MGRLCVTFPFSSVIGGAVVQNIGTRALLFCILCLPIYRRKPTHGMRWRNQ